MNTALQPDVFKFLSELKKNNNKPWFTENKTRFKTIEKTVKGLYETLTELLRAHDNIDRMKMFRIYRDVRFSKDKTPYKTHFGGSFHRTKPRLRGGYYLHLDPEEIFIATGFWEPHKDDLFRIRKEFEMDDKPIRSIIDDPAFKAVWGEFKGDAVKTAPKGFSKEHPAIDLIKRKQYIFVKNFTAEEAMASGFLNTVNDAFKAIRPYFDYMSEVLTTDLNGVSTID